MKMGAVVAACYSAACRPPTSGGSGGSSVKPGKYGDTRVNRHGTVIKGGESIGQITKKHGTISYDTEVKPGHNVHGKVSLRTRAVERAANRISELRAGTTPETMRDRAQMPQIPRSMQARFDSFLASKGVTSRTVKLDPNKLQPSQTSINQSRVDQMIRNRHTGVVKVSKDGKILDGHHTWLAAKQQGKKVEAKVYSERMATLIKQADAFVDKFRIPARVA